MPFSTATAAEGLEADLVDVGEGDAPAFAAAGDKVAGRLVLFHTAQMHGIEDLFREYMERNLRPDRVPDAMGASGNCIVKVKGGVGRQGRA